MFKSLILLFAFCACLFALTTSEEKELFEEFIVKYNKVYVSEKEKQYRFEQFQASLVKIDELNAESKGAEYGINQFADMSAAEFKAKMLTRTGRTFKDLEPADMDACAAKIRFPQLCEQNGNDTDMDWREYGAVTEVKDQGNCGSCWSFGTTGDLEGSWYLAGNDLISLSEQQLVSCDRTDSGCNGGLQENAFNYIIKTGGIQSEADYPYVSGNGRVPACSVNDKKFVANMSKWVQVSDSPAGEDDILPYVEKNGPVTIGINATPMQHYIRGIDDPANCNPMMLDHAVLIVGYGTSQGTDFWLIKNSWGVSWGEQGYYRIVRGSDACGLARDVVHSIV